MTKDEFLLRAAYENMTDEQIKDSFHRFYDKNVNPASRFELDITIISCATRAKELKEIVINE